MSAPELKILPDLKRSNGKSGNGFLIAGIPSAIGASICCVGSTCVARAWGQWCVDRLSGSVRNLPTDFYRINPIVLGFAFYRLYLVRADCSPGSACENPRTLKRQRLGFWIFAVLVLGLIAVSWFAPLFY